MPDGSPKDFQGRLAAALRGHSLYITLLLFLIVFPHLVGWITGEGPMGVQVGRRFMQIGAGVTWEGIVSQVFVIAILAISYNLMFGFTGVISFGHALFFGVGGYALGVMIEKAGLDLSTGLILGVVVGLALAAVLSFVVGLVSLRLRGVYFAVFTLAVAESFYIYFSRFNPTGGEDGFTIRTLPEWLEPTRNPLTFYYLSLILFMLAFLFIRRLMHSPTGAILLAIRENEDRAKAIGYNTLKYKLFAITLAGVMAAAAGMLYVILNSKKIGPEMLSVGFTVDPLLMTIIGGVGTFGGPVIGAAGLTLGERLLRNAVVPLQALGAAALVLLLTELIGSYMSKRTLKASGMRWAARGILALAVPVTIYLYYSGTATDFDVGSSWSLILGLLFMVVVMVFPLGVVGTWIRWRATRAAVKKSD